MGLGQRYVSHGRQVPAAEDSRAVLGGVVLCGSAPPLCVAGLAQG